MQITEQLKGFVHSAPLLEAEYFYPFQAFDLIPPSEEIHIPTLENTFKLGKRAEDLLEIYLNHSGYKVLAKNLQLIRKKETLGELDFLVQNHAGEVLHIELSYKLYLNFPELGSGLGSFLGPNLRDSLQKKTEHLKSRQLPILQQKQALEIIKEHTGIKQIKASYYVLLGQIYLPHLKPVHLPQWINPSSISGIWVHYKELSQWQDARFVLPPKLNWLVNPKLDTDWCSYQELLPELEKLISRKKAALIWVEDDKGKIFKVFATWYKTAL
ncbi:MAG: DUF1853 family protein [Luteibaculum sp.]